MPHGPMTQPGQNASGRPWASEVMIHTSRQIVPVNAHGVHFVRGDRSGWRAGASAG